MCKPRNINNYVKCVLQQDLFNANVDDTDDSEIDDNNDIGLVDDPNADVNDEMEISMNESNLNVLQEHQTDDNYMEIDDIPVPNNVEFVFEYESFPEINYDMIDCELALENMVEEIEAVLDNMDKPLCYYDL